MNSLPPSVLAKLTEPRPFSGQGLAHSNLHPDANSHAVLDHLNLVVVGHVDHGKSTLIGRLLFDTHSVAEGKAESIRAACEAEGMDFEYAFLLDALLEEQAQNITIDTTRISFRTPRRAFAIIDAPGHKEFLKNMITGAASADAAILIVDALEGLREQTRRHAYLLSLLGNKQIVVAVNKMDLVGFSETAFSRIRAELMDFLARLDVQPTYFVPIAAKLGEGLLKPSSQTPWYRGPSFLEALETFHSVPALQDAPLRLMVQDIYRFDARRIIAGFVEAGHVSIGNAIEFHPGSKRSRIKTIETWPSAAKDQPTACKSVAAGRSIAITLEDELFVERGQVGSAPEQAPIATREFDARLFWLHPEPLRVGDTLPLCLGTQNIDARLIAVARVLDTVTLQPSLTPASEVRRDEVAEVRLRTHRPLVCDPAGKIPPLGRFVLMRSRRIAGGGIIDTVVRQSHSLGDNLTITAASRASLLGHRGAVIWLTGLSGAGKSTLANGLEQRLFGLGLLPAILDGDVLRAGLCHGLGFSDVDRKENIRRAGEAALLLAEAGAIAVTALISPFRSDRQFVADRCKVRGVQFAEVFVNASLGECERRDPKGLYRRARAGEIPTFTGIDSPYEHPTAPLLEVRTDLESVDQSVEKLVALVLRLTLPFDGA